MEFNLEEYSGKCECGKVHSLTTKAILIESGAIQKLPEIAKLLELKPVGCIICDTNTKPFADIAAGLLKSFLLNPKPIIMLNADGLRADEKSVAKVEEELSPYTSWVLAVGSGTIHDISRYIAAKHKASFISCPTAASVDGYVSSVCAITWHGYKKTVPGVAPLAVVADTDIFSNAPYRLTASGIGDTLGKYTALADWQCGSLLTDEDFCQSIYNITKGAVDSVFEYLPAIHAGETYAFETLMSALLLSGIAMQLWGDSRPASGSEHHLSHFWEMGIINRKPDSLHGEQVGIGLLVALRHYEKIKQIVNIERSIQPYDGMPLAIMRNKFGSMYETVLKENQPDPLRMVSSEKMAAKFPELKKIISALPSARRLRPFMQAAGCVTTLEEIGLDRDIIPDSILLSPFVRRRFTIMRASKLLML